MATDPADRTIVRAACPHDCPDTCAMLVTTELRNGKRVATEITGDPTHPTLRDEAPSGGRWTQTIGGPTTT